jgi:hypothetical protein
LFAREGEILFRFIVYLPSQECRFFFATEGEFLFWLISSLSTPTKKLALPPRPYSTIISTKFIPFGGISIVRWLTVILATTLCLGCADNVELAKEAFENTLGNRDQLTIKSVEEFSGGVVCAEYKVSDEWGMRKPGSKFIYVDKAVDSKPSKEDWAIFCNADQNAALYQLTGIDAGKIESSTLAAIRADFEKLGKEFEMNKPKNVEMSDDPWGNPYIYEAPWYGGVKAEFKFVTQGADGKPGGKDENADIGNWHLPYIDFVRNQ